MSIELEKAAKILNDMEYLGFKSWYCDGLVVRTPDEIELHNNHAIETAEDYLTLLAGQGCMMDFNESEGKTSHLDAYDTEYKPIPAKVIDRLKAMGERSRVANNFNDNETINLAIQLISGKSEHDTIPTTDEALAIINEVGHSDTAWSIVALGHDDNGERNDFLLYTELIGTAMFYKAKGAKA